MTLGGIPETWTGGIAAGDHPPPGGGARPRLAVGTAACAHLRRRADTALPGLHRCGRLCLHHSSELDLSCSSDSKPLLACLLLSRCVRDARPLTNARRIAPPWSSVQHQLPLQPCIACPLVLHCQHLSGPAVQPLAEVHLTAALVRHLRWLMQHVLTQVVSGRRPPSPRGVRRPLSPRRRSPPGSRRAPPARGRTPPRRRTRSPPSKVGTAAAMC